MENVQASDISFDDKNGATDYSGGEYGYVSNAAAPLSFADSTVSNIRHLGYGGVPGLVFGGLAGLIYLLDAEKPMTMQRISASDVTADIENMDAGGVIGDFSNMRKRKFRTSRLRESNSHLPRPVFPISEA